MKVITIKLTKQITSTQTSYLRSASFTV